MSGEPSPRHGSPSLVAVDWGTSHLRVWALSATGAVLAERRSGEGMGVTPRDRFASVLESHLTALEGPEDVPIIMCGMVGSRQGWVEAPYLPVPVALADIAAAAVAVGAARRDIRIVPGLSKSDPISPDVMRSEETQLLGLQRRAGDATRIVCLPGTHSKWVRVDGGVVVDFATFMTGDLFAAVASHTVLRHSLSAGAVDSRAADFRGGVEASLASPADLLARMFAIRPAGLLDGLDAAEARARLSGYLIGQEIAGARLRFPAERVDLAGAPALTDLYAEALEIAGIACNIHDGDELVIAGLASAAGPGT